MLGTFYEERPELKERTMLLDDRLSLIHISEPTRP